MPGRETTGSNAQIPAHGIQKRLLSRDRILVISLVLLAVVIFSIQYFVFWGYTTDDAGITFGSAKTLIDHGQWSIDQYAERVEAYSTPLWMWLLAGSYAAHIPIPIAAKVMTFVFCVLTLIAGYLICRRYGAAAPGWKNALSPLLLAVMTGFVLWGASGLENGLYAFLTAGLLYGCLKFEKSKPWLITLFAFLIAAVRPEGILFALFAYGGLIIATLLNPHKQFRNLIISGSVFAGLYILFLFWGYQLFAWFVPNTYYAKVSSSFSANFSNGWHYTVEFFKSYYVIFILGAALLFLATFYRRGKARRTRSEHPNSAWLAGPHRVIWYSIIFILANLIYVLYVGGAFFGRDRFFTPLLVCLAILLTELFKKAHLFRTPENEQPTEPAIKKKHKPELKKKPASRWVYIVPQAVVGILVVLFVYQMAAGSAEAYKNPWVPFQNVKQLHASFGNQAGDYLISNAYLPNAKHVVYMVPDIGATSYYAENYTIIDSAMLGNVPIAHNKYKRTFFEEYIFNITRPVLIETHGSWSYYTNIGQYPEFTGGYVLTRGPGTESFGSVTVPNGYFIRKDLFLSTGAVATPTAGQDLVLTKNSLNSAQFTNRGQIQLETHWQRAVTPADVAALDNHTLNIYLENPQRQVQLIQDKIAGGYYLPSRWDANSEIVDRRVINLTSVPDGDYKLMIGITYPGKEMNNLASIDIQVGSSGEGAVNSLANEFNDSLAHNDDPQIQAALGKIKALDLTVFRRYDNLYLDHQLSRIEDLLNSGQPLEAYQILDPLAGSQTGDASLDAHLTKVEIAVSRAFEKQGQTLETQGDKTNAIRSYEKSMWLDPGNSHLRRHIEEIR
jgi:hypothetical protein